MYTLMKLLKLESILIAALTFLTHEFVETKFPLYYILFSLKTSCPSNKPGINTSNFIWKDLEYTKTSYE